MLERDLGRQEKGRGNILFGFAGFPIFDFQIDLRMHKKEFGIILDRFVQYLVY